MTNQWLTISETADYTGKSIHTIRKLIKKPNILTKYIDNKVFFDINSIKSHYWEDFAGNKKTEKIDDINNTNHGVNHIDQISSLIRENKRINDEYIKEKAEIWNQLILVERSKDKQILDLTIKKNEEILEKEQKIYKISRRADFLLFICTLFAILFAISAIFIYKMINTL